MKPQRLGNEWIDTQPLYEEATICLNVYTQDGLRSKVAVVPVDRDDQCVEIYPSGDSLYGVIAFRLFYPEFVIDHVGRRSDLTHHRQ